MKKCTAANAKKYADMRMRHRCPVQWLTKKKEMHREHIAFLNIGRYFWFQERALAKERYVTAMYGCPTSWTRIEAVSIYFNVEHKTTKRA